MTTFAPQTLKDLAAYWVANEGVNLGIVGDTSHVATGTSYHLGKSQLADDAYSATLPRDVDGLSEAASAIDLGKLGGSLFNLQVFSQYLVAACMAGMPGARDVREIIYTPNGLLPIHRYSGLDNKVYTGPGSGDDSHLYHTHISYWRDSEFRDKRPLFRPYFAGVIPPMPPTDTEPEEPDLSGIVVSRIGSFGGTVTVTAPNTSAIRLRDGSFFPIAADGVARSAVATGHLEPGPWGVTGDGFLIPIFPEDAPLGELAFVKASEVTRIDPPGSGDATVGYNTAIADASTAVLALKKP